VIDPQFERLDTVGSDWTEAKLNDQWVFVDAKGDTRLTMADTEVPDAEPCGPFRNGLATVRLSEHRLAWIDKAGQVCVGPVPGSYSHGFHRDGQPFGGPVPGSCSQGVHRDGVAALTYRYGYENDRGEEVRSAIINRKGEYVLKPGPWRVMPMFLFGDYTYVSDWDTGIRTYVDTKGRFLWLPEGHPWAERTD
jgi:hypothetical protein